jgi:hypothetical protein
MKTNKKAVAVLTLALATLAPAAYAAPAKSPAAPNHREDGPGREIGSRVDKLIEAVRRLIVTTLDEPNIPPPAPKQ